MTRSTRALGFVSLAVLSLAAFGARAQTAPSASAPNAATNVGEIVVTAERRATDIQRTPLAITAVPAQTLDKSFVTEVTGLNARVPSLESTKTSGFENIVTIRGVGSETPENDLTTVPGVSLFQDGVYLVNTISLSEDFFDVDHIEVLRGPQGALYGQSSIGGAINIITNQPELGRFASAGDFSAGDYSLFRERVWLNVPVGSTLALRASFQRFDHSGFTNDIAIPGFREDDAHNTGVKGAILWKPESNFTATLTGQWYRANENGQAQKNVNDPEPSPWAIFQDYPSKNELTAQLYHLNLQYDAPWFSVRSVTGYQYMNSILQEDSSRSAISLICPPGSFVFTCYDDVAGWNTWVKSWTEEFDILSRPGARLEWIVGGFLLSQKSRQFVAEFEGGASPNPPNVAIPPDIETNPPSNLAYGNVSNVTRHSDSIFAQATWHVTDRARITLGGRYNHDSYNDALLNFSEFGFSQGTESNSDNVWTWRVEGDYDLTPDNMLYVSGNRGYKPSGVNGNIGAFLVPLTFTSETNTAIEVGSKNFLFGRSLRLNVDAFYYFYHNMQYIETDPNPFHGGIANIPNVHVYGVEAEASYVSPDSRLRLNGTLALEDGRVSGDYLTIDSTVANAIEGTNAFCTEFGGGGKFFDPRCWAAVVASAKDINGATPPAMPKTSGEIDGSYTFDIPSGTLTPRVEFVYRGPMWARIFNEPSLDRVKAYGVVNLNLLYAPGGQWSHFTAQLTATNVGNVAGINSQYTDPYGTGQTSRQYIAPRQVIFTVGYSWP